MVEKAHRMRPHVEARLREFQDALKERVEETDTQKK